MFMAPSCPDWHRFGGGWEKHDVMKNLILMIGIVCGMSNITWSQTASQDPLADVYSAYIEVKNALTLDDAGKGMMASGKLYVAITEIQPERLNTAQKSVWEKYSAKLLDDAEQMKSAADITKQRQYFSVFSVNFYQVVKAFRSNPADVYYQFCPMANNGDGGYWLSEQSVIQNPYMGQKMPTCGTTKQTIGAILK